MPVPASAKSFPEASPLDAFFAWNAARRAPDRRYLIARDLVRLLDENSGTAGREACLLRLGGASAEAAAVVDSLAASLGSAEIGAHAAVFAAFEALAARLDLRALARRRVRPAAPGGGRRRILVVKLGALGDFVQALGPVPAIRQHHRGARLSLLTTAPYAGFAACTGLFDAVLVDRRPRPFDVGGWLALGRRLRRERFDRVYDLQTSDRSSAYASLLRGRHMPEWSGIAGRCSHPHANLDRDRMHTLDRQAEQLLMAGVWPVPIEERLPPVAAALPDAVRAPFALLIPGSSPGRLDKRWPAANYGALAALLRRRGVQPVVVGGRGETAAAEAIRAICPDALDLVGRTDIAALAALARAAALSVGNDTGATHVAAAGGNPVLVLFSRASAPQLCAPRGAGVRVMASPDLAALSVAEVAAAANSMLGPLVARAPA